MNKEELELYNKLEIIKTEREYLLRVYKELDSLIKIGYNGPFMGEEIRELTRAVQEYKNWKSVVDNKNINNLCDPYDMNIEENNEKSTQ